MIETEKEQSLDITPESIRNRLTVLIVASLGLTADMRAFRIINDYKLNSVSSETPQNTKEKPKSVLEEIDDLIWESQTMTDKAVRKRSVFRTKDINKNNLIAFIWEQESLLNAFRLNYQDLVERAEKLKLALKTK